MLPGRDPRFVFLLTVQAFCVLACALCVLVILISRAAGQEPTPTLLPLPTPRWVCHAVPVEPYPVPPGTPTPAPLTAVCCERCRWRYMWLGNTPQAYEQCWHLDCHR